MRFRMATIEDIPAMTKLYADYVRDEPPMYPTAPDLSVAGREWATHQVMQMAGNPNGYFCIVGVVKSEMVEGKVIGGVAKAMITVFLTQRPIGFPKCVAFCEMLLVDKSCRDRNHAKRLTLLACRYAQTKGAEVFEASWRSGSAVGESWKAVGMVPYQEYGAFILPDGTPRTDLIFADSELHASSVPATVKAEESP